MLASTTMGIGALFVPVGRLASEAPLRSRRALSVFSLLSSLSCPATGSTGLSARLDDEAYSRVTGTSCADIASPDRTESRGGED